MASEPSNYHDAAIWKVLAGLSGSLVSLRFIKGPWPERGLLFFGGTALSYFATPVVTGYFEAAKAEGLVGFLLGLFGMALMAKVYEAVEYVDFKPLVDIWTDLIKKRFKGSGNARK